MTDIKAEAVAKMQTYIAEHPDQKITMEDLSNVSCYSPWYSYRLFTEYLGISPAAYIRRLRLSNSALRLRDEKVKIIDAALACGFSSPESYQRAFYKEFGLNPKEYALAPRPIWLYLPFNIKPSLEETEHMNNKSTILVTVTEKPERTVCIKRGVNASHYFDYCAEVGCDIWGILCSMKGISGEPVSMWLPEAYRKPGTSEYVQGVEFAAGYEGPVPEGFDLITLPRAAYLMFQGEPFPEENYQTAIKEVWDAVERYDPSLIGYVWDKSNPRIQLIPEGDRGYIELHPVKKA